MSSAADELGPPRVRDLTSVSRAAAALLGLQALGSVALSASTFVRTFVVDSDTLYELEGALVRPDQLLYLLTGVVFLTWLYRAHQNLRAIGARPEHTAGFAVGCWFIPIGNLWLPYQVVADVWRNSGGCTDDDGAMARRERGVGLVAVWWALYIGKGVALAIAGFAVGSASTPFELANGLVILANLASIAAAVYAIRVVHGITVRLREAAPGGGPVVF